ncbi:MAG TPA: FHA domain-containing protein [Armatimonadota bacterium]|jgi:S-DNA-T family DNA segregation ATPase FtsK/SpoIIIE
MDERTQMIAGAPCPVCGAENGPTAEWCADCGFRLDSTPGGAADAVPGYRLLGDGESHPLKQGENVVGRILADVFLSDPSVSRRHAIITVNDTVVTVRDEGSSNGTKTGSAVLPPGEDRQVAPGQRIQFGVVVFHLSGADGNPVEPSDGEEIDAEAPVAGHLEGAGVSYAVKQGANSIGRKPGNDVVLSDPFVSGFHAVLTVADGQLTIIDSGSSNGTFISGRRLAPGTTETLEAGQEIVFGREALRYVPLPAEEEESADDAG